MKRKFARASERERQAAVDYGGAKAIDQFLYYDLQYDVAKTSQEGYWDSLPQPEPGDWLAEHQESTFTFEQYKKRTPRPRTNRTFLYIQPFGEFEEGVAPPIETIRQYAEIYFQMPTKVLPMKPVIIVSEEEALLDDQPVRVRENNGIQQLKTTDILHLLTLNRPDDAHCVMALTMFDLYPRESWNYVFGQARLSERVAIFSFIRYTPGFGGYQETDDIDHTLLLRRSLGVMVHETGHMMGLPHCIYFHCMMNGCNSLTEGDRQPNHVCPACLRKLQYHLQFDTKKRYQNLLAFYKAVGFVDDANWVERRLVIVTEMIKQNARK